MNELIWGLKQDLVKFFVEEVRSMSVIALLKSRIGLHSLEIACNGNLEINKKYNRKFSYILASNHEENEMIMFVYEEYIFVDFASITLYCKRNEKVFEFKTKDNKSSVSINRFLGNVGTEMIKDLIEFINGGLPTSLRETKEGVGYDIIEYKKEISLTNIKI